MSRYLHTAAGDDCFDPETVVVLGTALNGAWHCLEKSGVSLTSDGEAEATRAKLAQRIVENAKCGERDPARLRDDALLNLAKSILSQFKRTGDTGS
jgi:hypothetical protein